MSSLTPAVSKSGALLQPLTLSVFLFSRSDKMFPAFGFGAQIPPDYKVI